jgi:hypothetical protein
MPAPSTRFVRQVRETFNRHTPWTPNLSVTLGDVGALVDGVFEHRTTLATLGVEFSIAVKEGGSTIDFTSGCGVEVAISTPSPRQRGVPRGPGTRARITFSKTGDGLLQASDVDIVVIDDLGRVAEAILARYAAGTWERDWVFVTEVQTAAATTVMISGDDNASVEMDARGAIGDDVPLSSGFVVSKKSGAVMKWVGARGLTPLFALSRVKLSLLDHVFGRPRGSVASQAPPRTGQDPRALIEEVPLESPPPRRRASSSAPPSKNGKLPAARRAKP